MARGALDYFASLSEDVQGNLQQTVAALEARFGTAKNAMQVHAELASIRQQPGEATRDFADRVRQAGREAYPGARAGDPSVEATVVSRFVCGLREEQLRVWVLTKDPASLIEAVKVADKFERQQGALRAMRPPSEGEALAVQDRGAPGTARLDALESRADGANHNRGPARATDRQPESLDADVAVTSLMQTSRTELIRHQHCHTASPAPVRPVTAVQREARHEDSAEHPVGEPGLRDAEYLESLVL
ncbi:hypothetical protein FJT64_016646 [Amphibalanus amphitrite]|uniref:Retrotransposon gag domain-containing protein n=1 Tax=Amphibalanus amphitrite TaxID=1232801 RepID=A0A6A4WYL2_AMPAM|nr:hypothetical protein FJT64_016646 [Amphibalanus amphitrite]